MKTKAYSVVRLCFVLYACALVLATHWPKPVLVGAPIHSDKVIHFLAFAGWTALLLASGWFGAASNAGTRTIVLSLGLAYAIVDETAQGLPGINRVVSFQDMLANSAGVVSVLACSWAIAEARRIRGHAPEC